MNALLDPTGTHEKDFIIEIDGYLINCCATFTDGLLTSVKRYRENWQPGQTFLLDGDLLPFLHEDSVDDFQNSFADDWRENNFGG